MQYLLYLTATGAICGNQDMDRTPESGDFGNRRLAIAHAGVWDVTTQYVSGSPAALTSRPANPATIDVTTITANGTATATISSIQTGASVTVTAAGVATTYTVTDGTLELTSDTAGTIAVLVRGVFPNIDKNFTVTAT